MLFISKTFRSKTQSNIHSSTSLITQLHITITFLDRRYTWCCITKKTEAIMELTSALVLVFLSILSIWYGYYKYYFHYWKSRGVLCDEPSIPYGHNRIFGKEIHPAHFYKKMYDKYKPLGAKLCGVYASTKPIAVILDLDLVKRVLVKDFANFIERGLNQLDATSLAKSVKISPSLFWFYLNRFILQRRR